MKRREPVWGWGVMLALVSVLYALVGPILLRSAAADGPAGSRDELHERLAERFQPVFRGWDDLKNRPVDAAKWLDQAVDPRDPQDQDEGVDARSVDANPDADRGAYRVAPPPVYWRAVDSAPTTYERASELLGIEVEEGLLGGYPSTLLRHGFFDDEDVITLQYFLYFDQNHELGGELQRAGHRGAHEADWICVQVVVSAEERRNNPGLYRFQELSMGNHSAYIACTPDAVQWDDASETRPKIWLEKNSHEPYPFSGEAGLWADKSIRGLPIYWKGKRAMASVIERWMDHSGETPIAGELASLKEPEGAAVTEPAIQWGRNPGIAHGPGNEKWMIGGEPYGPSKLARQRLTINGVEVIGGGTSWVSLNAWPYPEADIYKLVNVLRSFNGSGLATATRFLADATSGIWEGMVEIADLEDWYLWWAYAPMAMGMILIGLPLLAMSWSAFTLGTLAVSLGFGGGGPPGGEGADVEHKRPGWLPIPTGEGGAGEHNGWLARWAPGDATPPVLEAAHQDEPGRVFRVGVTGWHLEHPDEAAAAPPSDRWRSACVELHDEAPGHATPTPFSCAAGGRPGGAISGHHPGERGRQAHNAPLPRSRWHVAGGRLDRVRVRPRSGPGSRRARPHSDVPPL